jgi:hypothetical protein
MRTEAVRQSSFAFRKIFLSRLGRRTAKTTRRTALSRRCNLNVSIRIPPEKRQLRQPVLGINRAPDECCIFDRQNARRSRKFRSGNFPANRAGSDFDLRIISNPLHLAKLAARHKDKRAAFFGEPDRRVNGRSSFAERGERDIFLSVNRSGDGHRNIVITVAREILRAANV